MIRFGALAQLFLEAVNISLYVLDMHMMTEISEDDYHQTSCCATISHKIQSIQRGKWGGLQLTAPPRRPIVYWDSGIFLYPDLLYYLRPSLPDTNRYTFEPRISGLWTRLLKLQILFYIWQIVSRFWYWFVLYRGIMWCSALYIFSDWRQIDYFFYIFHNRMSEILQTTYWLL